MLYIMAQTLSMILQKYQPVSYFLVKANFLLKNMNQIHILFLYFLIKSIVKIRFYLPWLNYNHHHCTRNKMDVPNLLQRGRATMPVPRVHQQQAQVTAKMMEFS
jgi:hypothetical protein